MRLAPSSRLYASGSAGARTGGVGHRHSFNGPSRNGGSPRATLFATLRAADCNTPGVDLLPSRRARRVQRRADRDQRPPSGRHRDPVRSRGRLEQSARVVFMTTTVWPTEISVPGIRARSHVGPGCSRWSVRPEEQVPRWLQPRETTPVSVAGTLPRERRGGLAERQVVGANFTERLQSASDPVFAPEITESLVDGHFEHVGDRSAAVGTSSTSRPNRRPPHWGQVVRMSARNCMSTSISRCPRTCHNDRLRRC
ncbi:MAG: hypothetical protein CM1200mP2_21060 [Planctomycetaceae bacterium]|nr:MAG: hypothetical protein CM1200mP2_21060 [Planctomycetaceae bacterium]